ncbi:hypothetical protein AGIG_G7976 [Arapaima gigas]
MKCDDHLPKNYQSPLRNMDKHAMLPLFSFVALLALAVNVMGNNTTENSELKSISPYSKRYHQSTSMGLTTQNTIRNTITTKTANKFLLSGWENVALIGGGAAFLCLLLCCILLSCCVCYLQSRLRKNGTTNKSRTGSNSGAYQDYEAGHLNADHEGETKPETVVLLEDIKSNEAVDGQTDGEPGQQQIPLDDATEDKPGTAINMAEDVGKDNTQPSTQKCSTGMPEDSATEDCQDVSDVPLMV